MARKRQEILDFLKGQGDEGKLTKDELSARLEAYNELGGSPEKKSVLNEGLVNEITTKLNQKANYLSHAPGLAKEAATFFLSRVASGNTANLDLNFAQFLKDRYPGGIGGNDYNELRTFGGTLSGEYGKRSNIYVDQDVPQDYSADIGRIQGQYDAMVKRDEQGALLDDFTNTLPAELARGREEFFGTQYDIARDKWNTDITPRIRASMNIRGLLDSGDLASELTRSAGDVQAGLEGVESDMQQQDDLFFQNAAYQTTLRKEIEAGRDITGAVESGRVAQRQNQEQSFQRSQADLKRVLDEELYKRESERQLSSQRERDRRAKDAASTANRTALIGSIAGSLGQIGGSAIGSSLASKSSTSSSGVTTR